MPWRPVCETATEIGSVYVLHFSKPVGTKKQQARHYVGWASDPQARIAEHKAGRGSSLTREAVRRGARLEVAQIIPNVTRATERRLKNRGGTKRICAICRGKELPV
jgi:predicted GIY-YIG superfamily endonuclease